MITTELLKQWGFIPTEPTVMEEDFSYDFDLNGTAISKQDLTLDDINLLKTIL